MTGREAEGRIGTLSRDTLTLVTTAGPRQLGEANVAKIRQRRSDSLQNGAIIGAAAGAAYGLALLALAGAWMTAADRFRSVPRLENGRFADQTLGRCFC